MKTLRNIFSISLITLLSACGGGSHVSTEMITGTFIDDPVQGLDYNCSSGTTGKTNQQGNYSCATDDQVTFSVNGIIIGTTPAQSAFITPYTFFPDKPEAAINLARLLQSIDIDGDASNGLIRLDPDQALPVGLDFNSPNFDTDTTITLVSASDAKKRLNDNIVSNGGTVPSTAIDPEPADTTAPVITLLGDNPVAIYLGSEYNEAGATALDAVDGDITVAITGTVDNNKLGAYTLIYTATDKAQNESTETRVVNVVAIPDTTAPVITLKGENPVTMYIGSTYNEAGATALDVGDGDITVTITGSVEINKLGAYTLTYTAIDKAQNESTKTRVVNVIVAPDTAAPDTPLLVTTLLSTNQDTFTVEIAGEAAASIWVGDTQQGIVDESGKATITLNTSGEDGIKSFSVSLKDSDDNESGMLSISVTKDTVAPDTNAGISKLQTANTSPALTGQLPSGENDTDTTDYLIKLLVNGEEYGASNNQDGKWGLPANSLGTLEEGFYDVTVTTTDAAGNTSSTVLTNAIEINNSGFLIDSALEGIKYVSGKYSGYTDKNGLFKYENDQDVTFYIGDESTGIVLGTSKVKADLYADRKVITIFDLAGSQDEKNHIVINMGRFLQSLDSDNDVSNGILIDVRSKESMALLGLNNRIDFKSSTEDFASHSDIESLFNDLAGHFGEHRGLISVADTQAHLVSVRDNTLPVQKLGLETTRGDKKETVISTGVFQSTNGVVEGIDYRSGNQFGRTNEKGEFSYEEGSTVKFSIYELVLGSTQSKAVITPADMVRATSFNHPKPRNIIRLLNAFDADSNDERISIDQAVRSALEKYRSQIDLNLPDGRANEELGISKGDDEFGAQFEDFELGQEILNEVSTLRAEG